MQVSSQPVRRNSASWRSVMLPGYYYFSLGVPGVHRVSQSPLKSQILNTSFQKQLQKRLVQGSHSTLADQTRLNLGVLKALKTITMIRLFCKSLQSPCGRIPDITYETNILMAWIWARFGIAILLDHLNVPQMIIITHFSYVRWEVT